MGILEGAARFIESPVTALVLCLLLGAVALSARLSLTVAHGLLAAAVLVAIVAILRLGLKDWRLILGSICATIALGCVFSLWMHPPKKAEEGPPKPIVRIVGIYLRPFIVGSSFALIVRVVNDGDRTIKVVSKFSSIWVETLPKEADHVAIEDIEEFAWRQLVSGEPISTGELSGARPLPLSLPPKMEVNVTDESLIMATHESVRKLDQESALYFCGTFTEDSSGIATPFCVRIDRFRESQGLTLCRGHN
jgi:hypothetical protein